MTGISQDQLKLVFRENELQRRAARRAILLNHTALEDEPMSLQDQQIDKLAKEHIRRQQEEWQRVITPRSPEPKGYWSTLFDAIRGKK